MNSSDKLSLFNHKAEELKRTRLLKNGFNPSITIDYEKMKGVRFDVHEPDEDDLRSFLILFRQFFLKNEPIFLNSIYTICHQNFTSQKIKEDLIEAKKIWKKSLKSFGLVYIFNGQELTPEYITDLWINGYYFHNDQEKVALLKRLRLVQPIVRYYFFHHLVEGTKQVLYLSNIITFARKEGLLN